MTGSFTNDMGGSEAGWHTSGPRVDLQVELRTGYHQVILHGDADGVVAEPLKARLEELVEEGGNGRLVVDLADSAFIDSAGLGTLVAVYKRCVVRGGLDAALVLLHPSTEVRELFRLTQLDSYLPLFSTREEARAVFTWIEPA
jgi:anti-sigma B factor antagonist